ncbi:MAG TPA: hypothetical protein VI461_06545 [Chitinophagaceae bacterium]|nr:hypothetical protein [Chitinophagaceae bacterium]
MKKVSDIASVETRAGFQEQLVEKFVQDNLPPRTIKQNSISGLGIFSAEYREIECCAAELPVNGTVEIFLTGMERSGIRRFNIPVISRFIVFCTREENRDYKVAWSNSLS